jgi:hypothetical protein
MVREGHIQLGLAHIAAVDGGQLLEDGDALESSGSGALRRQATV